MSVPESAATREPAASGGGVVVYGVVRSGTAVDRSPPGVAGAPLRLVEHAGVAALASTYPAREPHARRRDLLSHSAVLEHVLSEGPVLPLRFGTVLRDDEAVVAELLEPRSDELVDLLSRFEELVELRVKAFHREEELLREVVRADPGIRALREAVRRLPASASYAQRVQLGERVARAVEARRAADARGILAEMTPLAADVVAEHEPVAGLTLAASFLVSRGRVAAFDHALEGLAERHGGRTSFKCIGPLPPHSFVSLAGER